MAKNTTLVIGIGGQPDAGGGDDQPKGVTIPLPDDFVPPDGIKPGETFQVIADVRVTDAGVLIEKLDGKDVSGSEPDAPEGGTEDAVPAKKPTLVSSFKDLMKGHQS